MPEKLHNKQTMHILNTLIAYVDNLIAWGDTLVAQDTVESVNVAMILLLAAYILGQRPGIMQRNRTLFPKDNANIRKALDELGKFLRHEPASLCQLRTLRDLGNALYSRVSPNEGLIRKWDIVSNRLLETRHLLPPLFEPPIDPELLVRALEADLGVTGELFGKTLSPQKDDRREYEMTKKISLLQLNQLAFRQVITTGQCRFSLTEELFDTDFPGHYFRCINSISITIHSTSVHCCKIRCLLTLLGSSVRKSPFLKGNQYSLENGEDHLFIDVLAGRSDVINATQNKELPDNKLSCGIHSPFKETELLAIGNSS